MTHKHRSSLTLVAGTLAGLGIALALNIGVAAAAPSTPPPGNPIVVIVVCTATPDKTQVLQCAPSTSTVPTTQNTVMPPITAPTPSTSTASIIVDGTTDTRVDTYAKRQAIRDQYRGRINETTFNDELADGVSLDQALNDALAEVNLQSPPSR